MTRLGKPRVHRRAELLYMGIRRQTPFKGMFRIVDGLRKELSTWIEARGLEAAGPSFLRYHFIDMQGEMDIEYGIPIAKHVPGDARVIAGTLPAGRYASLVYVGHG